MRHFRPYGLTKCRSFSVLWSCDNGWCVSMRAFLVEELISYVHQLRKLIFYGRSQQYVARIGFSWTVTLHSLGISSWRSWGFQIWLFKCVRDLFCPSLHPHSSVFRRGRFTYVTLFSILTRGLDFSCKRYNLFRQLMLIVNQVLVCSEFPNPNLFQSGNLAHQDSTVLLTLRIYALYGCSLRMLSYMAGSGGILIAVALVRIFVLDVWHPRTKLLFASPVSSSVGYVWAKEFSLRNWRRLPCRHVKRHVKLSLVISKYPCNSTNPGHLYISRAIREPFDLSLILTSNSILSQG